MKNRINCAPPLDIPSFQLTATEGCSHNRCSFCTMFRSIPFRMVPLDEIEADLREAAKDGSNIERVFLASGDAFVLPADRLLKIAELIHQYLPKVEMIAAYATVRNIMAKSDDELAALADAGIGDLNIGVESGLEEVHVLMNKGTTVAEAKEQLLRLKKAGMPFSINIMGGSAGADRITENAEASAAFCNEVNPNLIYFGPLISYRGSRIAGMIEEGTFKPVNLGEFLTEGEIFLQNLRVTESIFYANHGGNPLQLIGALPEDQDKLLQKLRTGKKQLRKRGALS